MVRHLRTGLVGLGLIGGAGAVHYGADGSAQVSITQNGRTQSVSLPGNGRTYHCPASTHGQMQSLDIRAGRIKLTLQQVRGDEARIRAQYPPPRVPAAVVSRYKTLMARESRLVDAFNATVDEHNRMLESDCR